MVQSFDIWDTLLGRRCGPPGRIFELMAPQTGFVNFPARRRRAEHHFLQRSQPYGLEDIYREFARQAGLPPHEARRLADLEFATERDNVYLIRDMARNVREGDLLVSAMYLSEQQTRELLAAAGFETPVQLYVSCYEKSSGRIWETLKQQHQIECHYGDNRETDGIKPLQHGIRTVWTGPHLNDNENRLSEISPSLAWHTRYLRLSNPHSDETKRKLWDLQVSYNIPLLAAACHDLARVVAEKHLSHLLFSARDCNLLQRFWQLLYPHVPSSYLAISRYCLQHVDRNYAKYLREQCWTGAAVVDLAGTGNHLYRKVQSWRNQPSPWLYEVFWLTRFVSRYNNMPILCLTDQHRTDAVSPWVEMLNYAKHPCVTGVSEAGVPRYAPAVDYDLDLVQVGHDAVSLALASLPKEPFGSLSELAQHCISQIAAEEPFLNHVFPNHARNEHRRNLLQTP